MKRKSASLTVIFSVLITCMLGPDLYAGKTLQDWTLDEVLAAIEEANGGMAVIEATTNLRVRGHVDTGSIKYDFLLLKKRPDKMRIKMMFKGRSIETGFNGSKGWRRIIDNGIENTVELEAEELAEANYDLDFDGPLIGASLFGYERRLFGVERIGRVDYFVIEVTRANSVAKHYIDSRNFKELKTVREITGADGKTAELVSKYEDYRRLGSIWLAYRVERNLPDGRREIIEIESAEVDPGLLDQVFDHPREWVTRT